MQIIMPPRARPGRRACRGRVITMRRVLVVVLLLVVLLLPFPAGPFNDVRRSGSISASPQRCGHRCEMAAHARCVLPQGDAAAFSNTSTGKSTAQAGAATQSTNHDSPKATGFMAESGMQRSPSKSLNFPILDSSVDQHRASLPSLPRGGGGMGRGPWFRSPMPKAQRRAKRNSADARRGRATVPCQAQHQFPASALRSCADTSFPSGPPLLLAGPSPESRLPNLLVLLSVPPPHSLVQLV